jgi:hypothetical protein
LIQVGDLRIEEVDLAQARLYCVLFVPRKLDR